MIDTALFRGAAAQTGLEDLPTLLSGRAGAKNALWTENEPALRFDTTKRVVVADIKGPATITMIHFALPLKMKLNRDLLLKMYWDGQTGVLQHRVLVSNRASRPAAGDASGGPAGAGGRQTVVLDDLKEQECNEYSG